MAKKKQPKKNSKFWEEYFKKYYGDVETVKYDYRKRLTIVSIKKCHYAATAQLMTGDKWSFEIGFYVAYAKVLRVILTRINFDTCSFNSEPKLM